MYERAPVSSKVVTGIFERLSPQYHLFETAEELTAHPLLRTEQQGHYFKLVCEVNADRLSKLRLLDAPTRRIGGSFLGAAGMAEQYSRPDARQASGGQRPLFRKMLATAMSNLHASALENVDKVAAEICREIDSGIAWYNRSVREIDDKFKASTAEIAIGAIGGGLGLLVPALAPFLGPILPLAALTKLGYDALTRRIELNKKQSRSLIGVLAFAKDKAS